MVVLFPLAMLAGTRPGPDEASWFAAEEQRFIEELKADIAASPPAVITPSPQPNTVTMTDYLRSRGVFAPVTNYRQVGSMDRFIIFAPPERQ